MLTRTAIYEGAIEPGTDEDGFFEAVREKLEPIWRTFPEVLDVRVHRVRDADPGCQTASNIDPRRLSKVALAHFWCRQR